MKFLRIIPAILALASISGATSASQDISGVNSTGEFVIQPRNSDLTRYPLSPTSTVTLNSPKHPSSYGENERLGYNFEAPEGYNVHIQCTDMNVEKDSQGTCTKDSIKISPEGRSDFKNGSSLCGQGNFAKTSTGRTMSFLFTSGQRGDTTQTFRFSCEVSCVKSEGLSKYSTNRCTCGARNPVARIVGGTTSGVNEFPWRCGLGTRRGIICGSTLISNRWVLTAAHCCTDLKLDTAIINCGDHDMTTTKEAPNKVLPVERVINHSGYNSKTMDNDICLIKLRDPVKFTRAISPICLPWQGQGNRCEDSNTNVVSSGWGTTSSGGRPSLVLRKVDLPCISTQSCRRFYRNQVTNNMICTYKPGQDTCQGDSGGSIDYRASNGQYYGLGVVSWGVGCAGNNRPGVYATVQNYLPWIKQTTGNNSCTQSELTGHFLVNKDNNLENKKMSD